MDEFGYLTQPAKSGDGPDYDEDGLLSYDNMNAMEIHQHIQEYVAICVDETLESYDWVTKENRDFINMEDLYEEVMVDVLPFAQELMSKRNPDAVEAGRRLSEPTGVIGYVDDYVHDRVYCGNLMAAWTSSYDENQEPVFGYESANNDPNLDTLWVSSMI